MSACVFLSTCACIQEHEWHVRLFAHFGKDYVFLGKRVLRYIMVHVFIRRDLVGAGSVGIRTRRRWRSKHHHHFFQIRATPGAFRDLHPNNPHNPSQLHRFYHANTRIKVHLVSGVSTEVCTSQLAVLTHSVSLTFFLFFISINQSIYLSIRRWPRGSGMFTATKAVQSDVSLSELWKQVSTVDVENLLLFLQVCQCICTSVRRRSVF
jgi:hypothetical protein